MQHISEKLEEHLYNMTLGHTYFWNTQCPWQENDATEAHDPETGSAEGC